MSNSCFDDEIIESLRKSSLQKKWNKTTQKERGRKFIVRQSESKKYFANRMPKSYSGGDDGCGGRELSCGDYAPPILTNNICQVQVTEPCGSESDRYETEHYDSNDCDEINEVVHHKKRKRRSKHSKPKLNVKKTSRMELPALKYSSHGLTRCSCGSKTSGVKTSLARKWLGPFPDEIGLSIIDWIIQMYRRLVGSNDSSSSKQFQFNCPSSPIPNVEPIIDPKC